MKKLFLFIIAACIYNTTIAQQKKINEAAFAAAFKQILADSYKEFKNIKGKKLGVKDTFLCKVALPGTTISRIDFFGLGTYRASIQTKTKAENAAVAKQVVAAVKKGFLPLKTAIDTTDNPAYSQYGFYAITPAGFHNRRVAVNEIYSIPKKQNTVEIYVSAIGKREFEFANKGKTIKDDSLKAFIDTLLKAANYDYWDGIIGDSVGEKDMPFERPFGMYDGEYYNTTLKLPGAETFLHFDGSTADFLLAYKIPGKLNKAQKSAFLNTRLSKLRYALPKFFVQETTKNEYEIFNEHFYTADNYDMPLYEGIEIEASDTYSNEGNDDTWMVFNFILRKSFFKPLPL